MRGRQVVVEKKRDVQIHAHLWKTADYLLEQGLKGDSGSFHLLMASLVFRAFSLEAALNWLGGKLVAHWKYLDRLKPADKLKLLAEVLDVPLDLSQPPWQIMKDLFGFRNDIAHGKPEQLSDQSTELLADFLEGKSAQLKTKWEKFCTKGNAKRAKADVERIVKALFAAANLKEASKPFAGGVGFHRTGI